MKKFKEFNGAFKKEYTDQEKKTYKMVHGEDETDWPGAGEYEDAPVAIDLDSVVTFNPHTDEDKLTIEVSTGTRFSIYLSYKEFAEIMQAYYSFV